MADQFDVDRLKRLSDDFLEGVAGFDGECREDIPFGETFYVFDDGKQFRSCTHRPPHIHPVD